MVGRTSLAGLVLVAFAHQCWAGVVLFDQPFGNVYRVASQDDTRPGGDGLFAQAFDNFTLADDATVTGIQWSGQYFDGVENGPITGFHVAFLADAAGRPGTSLATFAIPGAAGETFLGRFGTSQSYAYTYAASGLEFAATGGTPYWVSVWADLPSSITWGWHSGATGDGTSVQDFFGTQNPVSFDLAFALDGVTPVPEPTGLGIVVVGLAGLAVGWARTGGRRGGRD